MGLSLTACLHFCDRASLGSCLFPSATILALHPLSSVTLVIVIEFTVFSFVGLSSAVSGTSVPVSMSAFRSFSIAAFIISR